jgi:hypothetical protein
MLVNFFSLLFLERSREAKLLNSTLKSITRIWYALCIIVNVILTHVYSQTALPIMIQPLVLRIFANILWKTLFEKMWNKSYLTFMGPCIVIYFYSKTNKMHLLASTRWKCSSISCPLASSQRTSMTYTWRCMYSLGLLIMDGKTVRNM